MNASNIPQVTDKDAVAMSAAYLEIDINGLTAEDRADLTGQAARPAGQLDFLTKPLSEPKEDWDGVFPDDPAAPPADSRDAPWSPKEIAITFDKLTAARIDHADAIDALETARAALADVKVDLTVNGLVEGKNAEARDADLAKKCQEEIDWVRRSEHSERQARLVLDCAKDHVRMFELIVASRGM
jgi:hypothetical protein